MNTFHFICRGDHSKLNMKIFAPHMTKMFYINFVKSSNMFTFFSAIDLTTNTFYKFWIMYLNIFYNLLPIEIYHISY